MNQSRAASLLVTIVVLVVIFGVLGTSSYKIVAPGNRGVKVTLGSVSEQALPEGLHFKAPFITRVDEVSVRTRKVSFATSCYSSDLQQVQANVAVVYSIPESSVVNIYRNYAGDPFEQFVKPLVQEALKEVCASRSAERIVKEREPVKSESLDSLRRKVGGLITISDLAIENFDLSNELERAIEAKMVQEQEAARAKFAQQQAQIEAETAKIRAQGEADAITVRGAALKENKDLVSLQIVEKWDGRAPSTIMIGGENSNPANLLLPIAK